MKSIRLLCCITILSSVLPSSASRSSADTIVSATSTTYDRSPLHHLGGSRSWRLQIKDQRCRFETQANVYLLAGPGHRAVLTDLGSGRLVRLDLHDSTFQSGDLHAYAESLDARLGYRHTVAPPAPDPTVRRSIRKTGERQRIAGLDCERWTVRCITPPVEDARRARATAWSEQWQDLWVAAVTPALREAANFYERAAESLPPRTETRTRVLDELGAFLIRRSSIPSCGCSMSQLEEALAGRVVARALTVNAMQPSRRDLERLLTEKSVRALAQYVWGGDYRSIMSAIDSLFGPSAMERYAESSVWPGPHTGVTTVSAWTLEDLTQAWIPPMVFEVPPGFQARSEDDCGCCLAPPLRRAAR